MLIPLFEQYIGWEKIAEILDQFEPTHVELITDVIGESGDFIEYEFYLMLEYNIVDKNIIIAGTVVDGPNKRYKPVNAVLLPGSFDSPFDMIEMLDMPETNYYRSDYQPIFDVLQKYGTRDIWASQSTLMNLRDRLNKYYDEEMVDTIINNLTSHN